MIRLSFCINHIHRFQINLHARNAKIIRRTQQLVQILLMSINPGDRTIILNANSKVSAISIRHGNNRDRKINGLDPSGLPVHDLFLRRKLQVLDFVGIEHSRRLLPAPSCRA